MRITLVSYAFMLLLCLGSATEAQVSTPITVSEWFPEPVASKPETAKKAEAKPLGEGIFRIRSASPSVDRQTGKTTDATSASAPDGPDINSIVIGPCCDCNRILLDGIFLYQNVTLSLSNSTPNSTVPVTLGHGGPGRIGFATNLNGPYTDSLVFNVTTNSSGNGSLVITFYIKGLDAGQSNMVTTVASGSTNPVPQMEVFACQCPPAP